MVRLLGSLLALAALAYFGNTLAQYWPQTSDLLRQPTAVRALALAMLLLVMGYVLSALCWQQICRALDLSLRPLQAMRIYFVSQFGKYLPGNVAQHAGRLALGMRENLSGTALATSQMIEIALVIAMMAALVLLSGTSDMVQWKSGLERIAGWQVPIALLVLSVLGWLGWRIPGVAARVRHVVALLRDLSTTRRGIGRLAAAALLALANIVVTAAALHLLIIAVVEPGTAPSFPVTCQIFIAGWLAGFVTPGSPAGLGVREAVMLKMLSQSVATPDAAAICLLFRIATTLTDLLVFAVGWYLPARNARPLPP